MNENWVYMMFGFTWILWKFQFSFPFFYIFSVASQTKFFFSFFFLNLSFIYFISTQGWLCSYGVLAWVQRGYQAWISRKIQRKNCQLINYTKLTQARPLMIGYLFSSIVPTGLEIVQIFNPRLRVRDPVNLES